MAPDENRVTRATRQAKAERDIAKRARERQQSKRARLLQIYERHQKEKDRLAEEVDGATPPTRVERAGVGSTLPPRPSAKQPAQAKEPQQQPGAKPSAPGAKPSGPAPAQAKAPAAQPGAAPAQAEAPPAAPQSKASEQIEKLLGTKQAAPASTPAAPVPAADAPAAIEAEPRTKSVAFPSDIHKQIERLEGLLKNMAQLVGRAEAEADRLEGLLRRAEKQQPGTK